MLSIEAPNQVLIHVIQISILISSCPGSHQNPIQSPNLAITRKENSLIGLRAKQTDTKQRIFHTVKASVYKHQFLLLANM